MKWLLLCALPFVAVAAVPAAADTPPANPPADAFDLVYFADARPVLLRLHLAVDGKPLSGRWDEAISRVFTALDTNGDGSLDRQEVRGVPPPAALFGVGATDAPTLAELDTNGDGKVSRAELADYYARNGATALQVPGQGQRNANETRFLLQLAELQAVQLGGGRGGGGDSDALTDALFRLLDTDGDGKLSREELLAAPAVLMARDRNDDEMLTPDEILSRGGSGFDAGGTRVVLVAPGGGVPNTPNSPFTLIKPGEPKLALGKKLLNRYGKRNKPSQAPTALTAQELGLDNATFAALDVDGNGSLDENELSRYAMRSPDLELKLDLGTRAAVDLVKQGRPLEANVRAEGGVLMLELAGTRLDLKSLASQPIDEARLAQQTRAQYLAEFQRADRDKNGYLDLAEAQQSPLFGPLFKLMDRDGDGMLYEKEVLAYLDATQAMRVAARVGCASLSSTSDNRGLFEMLDTDGDGRLSVRELRNAVKLLALDRDGDGRISRLEIPRLSQATFRMGPAAGEDQVIQGQRARALRQRGGVDRTPAQGPEWFRKMDRNGDGDVSRREFLGTDAQFKEIDTDGDGLISPEEAEAFDRKHRAPPEGRR